LERQRSSSSAFFFIGDLTPQELANFNVQNVPLDEGGPAASGPYLEVFGHTIAVWWPSRPRDLFDDLRDRADLWIRTVTSCYYLASGVALDARLAYWVEARDVVANEAVIGIADPRFHHVRVVDPADARNEPMRAAIRRTQTLRGFVDLEPALHELWRAACDPSDEAFLSAFRSLECVRRMYERDDVDSGNRAGEAWTEMARDLGVERDADYELLAEVAKSVRHGDRPARRDEDHPINDARRERDELVALAKRVVTRAIEKHADPLTAASPRA
jgi:hypothetical protein